MTAIWSAGARVRRFCDAEAALARAARDVGLIPAESATAIDAACANLKVEPVSLLDEGWALGTPILALLAHLGPLLAARDAQNLHFGATSQDIIDTAAVLQIRDAFGEIANLQEGLADGLAACIEKYAHDWVMGRTLMQPALPTRFAWRVACWLDAVLELNDDVATLVAHLPVQLGGPVGDLSTFGGKGTDTVVAFARQLGLAVPSIPWHTDRRPIVSSVALAQRAASAAEKIATDLVLLSQGEVGEIRIPAGGSSSMPHKKNAMLAVRAVAAARACRGVGSVILHAPSHELERAAGSWHAEWFAVPLVFHTAGASLSAAREAVSRLEFDAERASSNLDGAVLPSPSDADRLVGRVVERHRLQREQRRR